MTTVAPEPVLAFEFFIRDVEHFRNVVYWLNNNIGRSKKWKMSRNILRHFKTRHKTSPKKVNIRIFTEGWTEQEIKVILTLY